MMKEFVLKFTDKLIFDEAKIISLENEFYTSEKNLVSVHKRIEKKPVYIGDYMGKALSNKFIPSLQLLNLLNKSSNKKILVNDKGEWLFICGRDLFKENIIDTSKVLKQGDFALIVNKYQECIGIGILKQDKNCFVKNYFDIGDFLRRERKR